MIQIPETDLQIDERQLVAGCIDFLVLVQYPDPDDVRDFIDRGLGALGDRAKFYIADNMRDCAPFGDKAMSKLDTWLSRPRPFKQYWMQIGERGPRLGVSAGSLDIDFRPRPPLSPAQLEARHAADQRIFDSIGRMVTPPVTHLRLTLPVEQALADPAMFRDWVMDFRFAQRGTFVAGHAGLAINIDISVGSDRLRAAMVSRVASVLARHPGIGWHNPGSMTCDLFRFFPDRLDLVPQFLRVHWLTLLRDETLGLCGETAKVKNALTQVPGVLIHPLPGGIAVQIGDAPQPGDLTKRDFLNDYRAVARILAPARLPKHSGITGDRGAFPEAAAQAWLEAFERDYDAGGGE